MTLNTHTEFEIDAAVRARIPLHDDDSWHTRSAAFEAESSTKTNSLPVLTGHAMHLMATV